MPVPAAAAAARRRALAVRVVELLIGDGRDDDRQLDLLVPSTVVAVETSDTSQSTRGRNVQRAKAARFSRSVHSSPEPPARYAHGPGSSRSSASRS